MSASAPPFVSFAGALYTSTRTSQHTAAQAALIQQAIGMTASDWHDVERTRFLRSASFRTPRSTVFLAISKPGSRWTCPPAVVVGRNFIPEFDSSPGYFTRSSFFAPADRVTYTPIRTDLPLAPTKQRDSLFTLMEFGISERRWKPARMLSTVLQWIVRFVPSDVASSQKPGQAKPGFVKPGQATPLA
ncbi:hypothetical protein DFH07DRAFT_769308 [Mycena maculata]|uniref:Uncharacterized protein n=1 Tax=Mycena maculata TaxID=230809 RepID=A0AAD7JNP1_9AGAR|nr:hypothetical protein DFH07DRAFT_769308 [Mycena maculata]